MSEDDPFKKFDKYMETLNWKPTLQQRMRHDLSDKELPTEILPDHPAFDVDAANAELMQLWEQYPHKDPQQCAERYEELARHLNTPAAVFDDFHRFLYSLMVDNGIYCPPRPNISHPKEYTPQRERYSPQFVADAEKAILHIADKLIEMLPAPAFKETTAASITIPLYEYLEFPHHYPTWLCQKAFELQSGGQPIFDATTKTLSELMLKANGHTWQSFDSDKHKLVYATDAKGTPLTILNAYLPQNSYLKSILTTDVPFEIPLDVFKEHGFLFAKSGHGKTQTLRAIFASLIERDCSIILIDGNGPLVKGIERIASIQDRLLVLDAKLAPPMNLFKMHGASREKQKELFFYVFKAIDQDLTARQSTMVAYLIDFLQHVPNANIKTLSDLCAATKELPYAENLIKTDEWTQHFFRTQFLGNDPLVKQTKSQIAQRLLNLVSNRAFMAMFNATENIFDAFEAMQQKKIVIINTDRNHLGDQGSAIFGRYALAQCLAAAWERPEGERHLALIICDEAKAYLDDQSQKILSDARNFGVGLLLATQFPDQLQEGVRKEVINNTSVRFCGPTAFAVAAQVQRDMRCSVDFIMDMKKRSPPNDPPPHYADWACYVDNVTPKAIKLRVPFFAIEQLPVTPPPLITPPPPREGTMPRYRETAPVAPAAPPPAAFLVGDIVQVTVGGYDVYRWGARITKIDAEAGMAWVDPTEFCPPHLVDMLNDRLAALKPGEVLTAEEQVIERQATVPSAGVLLKDLYSFKSSTPPPQSPPPIPKRERFTPP